MGEGRICTLLGWATLAWCLHGFCLHWLCLVSLGGRISVNLWAAKHGKAIFSEHLDGKSQEGEFR